jgi:DNA (cytosine-5)-methyltransferase 1
MALTVGSAFSGIGGIDLGLQRAGMEIRWQIEIDDWCQRVLAKHWPDVTRYGDIREITGHELEPVDVIAGGFPCQNISSAGKKEGIDGEHSSLWRHFSRIIAAVQPRYVLIENSDALRHRGLHIVLQDLAALGFDAEWSRISACSVGAPHLRRRMYIVAYANRDGEPTFAFDGEVGGMSADAGEMRRGWLPEPDHVRMAHGLPNGLDRLGGIGNSVVPQVVELIGRRIVAAA